MNAEELCKKMQEEKKSDCDGYYEEEMGASEYYAKYSGTRYFSVREYLRLARLEQEKYKRNY